MLRSRDGRHPQLRLSLSSLTPSNPERPMGNYHPLPDYMLGVKDLQGEARKEVQLGRTASFCVDQA